MLIFNVFNAKNAKFWEARKPRNFRETYSLLNLQFPIEEAALFTQNIA